LCGKCRHIDPLFQNVEVNLHRHRQYGHPHHDAYLAASAAAAFAADTMSFISLICSLNVSPNAINDGGSGGGREGRVASLMLLLPLERRLLRMIVLFAAT
jgi:hypothetical protein